MNKSRLATIGIAVAAAAIILPRLMRYANDPANKNSFVARLINPA